MLATPQEACKEYARNVGEEFPDQAWILTCFDSWEPNPFYTGPKVPHPESDYDEPPCDAEQRIDASDFADEIPF